METRVIRRAGFLLSIAGIGKLLCLIRKYYAVKNRREERLGAGAYIKGPHWEITIKAKTNVDF